MTAELQPRATAPKPFDKPADRSSFEVSTIETFAELESVLAEWSELHRAAGSGSPFEHPSWAATWARSFVGDGDLMSVAVRDRRGGKLVGFAPFYRRRHSSFAAGATCVQPLGMGAGHALTEVSEILCAPGLTSKVLPAVIGHLEDVPGWNWLQLTLGPEQGWLVPQWLRDRASSSVLHRGVRPCVLFRGLPPTRPELVTALKRNVRESLRRGVNRTRKIDGFDLRVVSSPDEVEEALAVVAGLHHQRAALSGKVSHSDLVADLDQQRFLRQAAGYLAADGLARVHLAAVGDRKVAGLLVMSDGSTDYVSLTGLDPVYWDLNLNTLLIFEALVAAGERGRTSMNLSTGPDVSKLRWSPEIATYHDFAVVRGDLRSQKLYGAYSHVSLARRHRQERLRHRNAD